MVEPPPNIVIGGELPQVPIRVGALPPPPDDQRRTRMLAIPTAAEWAGLLQGCDVVALREFAERYRGDPLAGKATNLAEQCDARTVARREVMSTLARITIAS
jgi:hypothetical protein